MGFPNNMAPGDSEAILLTEHESKTFHHFSYSRKKVLKTLKIAFLATFKKNVQDPLNNFFWKML